VDRWDPLLERDPRNFHTTPEEDGKMKAADINGCL
jgi:hypothetical protein